MKIGLVAPTEISQPAALEGDLDNLARGLAMRGAEVEILTQSPVRRTEDVVLTERVSIRRFPSVIGPLRSPLAPGLWEWLRAVPHRYDVIDVHTRFTSVALAVARACDRHRVFTPRTPIHRLIGWPYVHATRRIVSSYTQIVCASTSERDLLCQRFPLAAERVRVVPPGVDAPAIRAAVPFERTESIVLVVGPLERSNGIARAIAAMAALDVTFRLVVVGDGPDRDSLRAYAADLRVSPRVEFAGSASNSDLYRWLRTARVVVDIVDQHTFHSRISEALVAGVPVVASDIPAHRETAAQFSRPEVVFVPPMGSPLQLADAIVEAARIKVTRPVSTPLSRESVVDRTWDLYSHLVSGREPQSSFADRRNGTAHTLSAESVR